MLYLIKITFLSHPIGEAVALCSAQFVLADVKNYYAIADIKSRVLRNLIHASDSVKSSDREIALWFKPSEIQSYKKDLDKHF